MKAIYPFCSIYLLLLACCLDAFGDTEHSISSSLRMRVGASGDTPEATALSLRAELNWQAEWSKSWTSTFRVGYVVADNHRYFDGVKDNGFDKIPDAAGLSLTEGTIRHLRPGTEMILGRQRVSLLGGRLAGANGFWQKPQVFDAFTVEQSLWGQAEVTASYLWQANRIAGPNAGAYLHRDDLRFAQLNGMRPMGELGEHALNSWLLEGTWRHESHTIKLLTLRHVNETLSAHDNVTAGLSYQYAVQAGRWRVSSRATGLTQERADNTIPYYDLLLRATHRRLAFGLQRETLGSQNRTPFITPLASLHDFQGVTDQFLTTPAEGLHDNSASASFKFKWLGSLAVKAHYFESESGKHVGEEFSIEWDKALTQQVAANFRAGQFRGKDDRELWKAFLTIDGKFSHM